MTRHLTAITIVLITAGAAGAQTMGEQTRLDRAATAGDEVVVVTDGRRGTIRGTLVDATAVQLELRTRSGTRFIDFTQVVRVDRPGDPVLDGVLRGMAVATSWCALTCAQTPDGRERPSAYLGRAALGGLVGGLIDSRINGRRTLYRRPSSRGIGIGVGRSGVEVVVGY